MQPVEMLIREASELPEAQRNEIIAMAQGMAAVHQIAQERGA